MRVFLWIASSFPTVVAFVIGRPFVIPVCVLLQILWMRLLVLSFLCGVLFDVVFLDAAFLFCLVPVL